MAAEMRRGNLSFATAKMHSVGFVSRNQPVESDNAFLDGFQIKTLGINIFRLSFTFFFSYGCSSYLYPEFRLSQYF